MRGRVCWVSAVLVALLRCAAVPLPRPTPDHPIAACYISCKEGYFNRGQHSCRGDRRRMLNINITSEDDVPGDPQESRWFTGLPSYGADYIVRERLLTLDGLIPPCREGQLAGRACSAPLVWGQRYAVRMKEVQNELGDEARAAYNKQDVELMTCESYIARICGGIDAKCSMHPGEDLFGQPIPPQ